jgi:hypothetical protein
MPIRPRLQWHGQKPLILDAPQIRQNPVHEVSKFQQVNRFQRLTILVETPSGAGTSFNNLAGCNPVGAIGSAIQNFSLKFRESVRTGAISQSRRDLRGRGHRG